MGCEYVVSQKKRGLRAGYVSQLERRLGKNGPVTQSR